MGSLLRGRQEKEERKRKEIEVTVKGNFVDIRKGKGDYIPSLIEHDSIQGFILSCRAKSIEGLLAI